VTLGCFQAEKGIDYLYSIKYTRIIKITNTNSSCAASAGALVDIWHCTALGYYSDYSDTPGGGYATISYTSSHFLGGVKQLIAGRIVLKSSLFARG
jgi:protocatechuate 3,4-dioxygenase beta subunit